jgi:hypothetical protein
MSVRSFVAGRFVTTYQLSNASISDSVAEGNAPAVALVYGTDGSASAGGPWSDSNLEDGTGHHISIASHDSGDLKYTGTPTIGTWAALSSTVTFNFVDSDTTGPYSRLSTYTIELSDDGGSTVLDSMTLSVTLTNDGP